MEAKEKETDTATVIAVLRITPRKTIMNYDKDDDDDDDDDTATAIGVQKTTQRKSIVILMTIAIGNNEDKKNDRLFLQWDWGGMPKVDGVLLP